MMIDSRVGVGANDELANAERLAVRIHAVVDSISAIVQTEPVNADSGPNSLRLQHLATVLEVVGDNIGSLCANDSSMTTYTTRRPSEEQHALVLQNRSFVAVMVRSLLPALPKHVDPKELESAGTIGLIHAAETFDPNLGILFTTFAARRVKGSIIDYLRQQDLAPRSVRSMQKQIDIKVQEFTAKNHRSPNDLEIAEMLGTSVEQVRMNRYYSSITNVGSIDAPLADDIGSTLNVADNLQDDQSEDPSSALIGRELIIALRDHVDQLPDNLRYVITQYFFEEVPLADIGWELGVSESRASQLCTSALGMLSSKMRSWR